MTPSDKKTAPTNFLLYTSNTGEVKVDVFFKDETVWLTQKAIGELFGKERSVITKHLKNIFDSGELDEHSVRANFAHTAANGKNYKTKFYNLDAIISVGYRVNSYHKIQIKFIIDILSCIGDNQL